VPWFVAWRDGKPEFRAMDTGKLRAAVKNKLCWVCGWAMGSYKAFVIGPMCAVSRISSEPPSHVLCAEWSARNCPFLSRPHMVRRENDLPEDLIEHAGVAILRNPGVTLVWVTKGYQVVPDGITPGRWVIEIGEPEQVHWWTEGRPATRAEVERSVEEGLPALLAASPPGSGPEIDRLVGEARKLFPLK
jgi:hypothetical protein